MITDEQIRKIQEDKIWMLYGNFGDIRGVIEFARELIALAQQEQAQSGWLRAIDEALVCHDVGIVNADDTYEQAKDKLNKLLCVVQDIGAYFAKQEPAQAVPIAIVKQIDALSTHAYCEFINQLKQDVCLGVEYKMEKGKFGKAELAAHQNAKQWWGRHMAYSEVLKILGTPNPAPLDSDTRRLVLELCAQVIRNSGEYEHIPGTVEAMAADIIERLEAGE